MSPHPVQLLDRRVVVAQILEARGDALVVTSLGNPTYDVAAAGDAAANFYLWGAMGGAAMLALGIALAQPSRRVVAFLGDGEIMMGLGSLATIAVARAENLALVVLDNERYAETGGQFAHTGRGVDLARIGVGAGMAQCREVRTVEELNSIDEIVYRKPGPVLVTVKVSTVPVAPVLPPRDGPYLRSRFRAALLGSAAHD
jgi:thiamine pyrophosphate-dependent acetolactate synthase large subunit-like protein